MAECTRCGTPTERDAHWVPDEGIGDNGVVWLCDNCTRKFEDWLDT